MADQTTPPAFAGPPFDRLVELARPVVIRLVTDEVEALLRDGVTEDRLDAWIRFVEGYDAGFVKKRVALHLLKKKRKQLRKTGHISLSDKERAFLLEKAESHLPPKLIHAWLSALHASAMASGGKLRISSFDDSMLPVGASLTGFVETFDAFGVTRAKMRHALLLIRRAAGARVPEEALDLLRRNGVTFVD